MTLTVSGNWNRFPIQPATCATLVVQWSQSVKPTRQVPQLRSLLANRELQTWEQDPIWRFPLFSKEESSQWPKEVCGLVGRLNTFHVMTASSQATHPMSQAQVEQSLTFVPWAWANRDLNKHGVRPFTASRGKSASEKHTADIYQAQRQHPPHAEQSRVRKAPVNLEHLQIAWPKSIRKECKSQAQASLLPFRFSCEWGL